MTKTNETQDRRIVVLAEKWVFIGDYHAATATAPAFLTDAACVRRWGTTAGLGQLALDGPTPSTQLDPCGLLVLDNPSAVIYTIKCQN